MGFKFKFIPRVLNSKLVPQVFKLIHPSCKFKFTPQNFKFKFSQPAFKFKFSSPRVAKICKFLARLMFVWILTSCFTCSKVDFQNDSF